MESPGCSGQEFGLSPNGTGDPLGVFKNTRSDGAGLYLRGLDYRAKLARGEQLHETLASMCEEQVRCTAGHHGWGPKSRRDFRGDQMDLAAQ